MSKGDFGATSSSYGAVYHRSDKVRDNGKFLSKCFYDISKDSLLLQIDA